VEVFVAREELVPLSAKLLEEHERQQSTPRRRA
jgi:hypothetical protein